MVAAAISTKDFADGLRKASQPIDFTPLCKILSIQLVASCKDNIDRSQSPDGVPYAPLKHPRPNSKGGDIPLLDDGILRSSIVAIYVGDRGFIVGTNLEYAAVHQFGARIVPKNAKYLAIPATVEAKQKGSPRNWGEELEFRVIQIDGKWVKVLCEKQPKAKKKKRFTDPGSADAWRNAVQYYLAKEVTIPARPYLGVSKDHADDMEQMVADYVADVTAKRLRDAWGQP